MTGDALSDWDVKALDVPARGFKATREATPEERAEIASALDLLAVDSLTATYKITGSRGRYHLEGMIEAKCTQSCVVSLEPVPALIREQFTADFVEDDTTEPGQTGEMEVLSIPDIEMMHDGVIQTGRVVFETFAASLDPYPRKPDAAFGWTDAKAQDAESKGPFSVLASLKGKSSGK